MSVGRQRRTNPALLRVSILAIIVVGVATAIFGATSALAAPTVGAPLTLAVGSLQLQQTSTSTLPGGDEFTTWSGAGLHVTAAAAPGSTVVVHRVSSTYAYVGINPPPGAAIPAPMSPARASQVVYANAIAVGFTPAQAAARVHSLGLAAPGEPLNPLAQSATIIGSPCAHVDGGPIKGTVQGDQCDVVTLLQAKKGAYYIGNSNGGNGFTYYDCGSSNGLLTYFNVWYQYNGESGDTRVAQNPLSTQSIPSGPPVSIGIGVSFGGLSLSGSVTIQPSSKFGPYYPHGSNPNLPAAGAFWSGRTCKSRNKPPTYTGAASNEIVHLGPGQKGVPTPYVGIGWS